MKKSHRDTPIEATHHACSRNIEFEPLPAGTRINDRYRLTAFLGRGGFAAVYAAVDEILNESVALKIFFHQLSLDRNRMLRIKREINLSRRIADPRVVKVFSLDRWRDSWFLVMELVEGETLKKRLDREGAWEWNDFRPFFLDILAGIAALHGQKIVHRDIKPSNIMLPRAGGVRILDFGLAKELEDPEHSVNLNEIVGTPRYLSPEQLQGGKVDVRSDVFQLGLLLQTVLRGAPPMEGMDTLSILAHRMGRTPETVKLEGLRLPLQVRLGLERALSKLPFRRFRDAAAMLAFFSSPRGGRSVLHIWLHKWSPAIVVLLILGIALAAAFRESRAQKLPGRLRIDGGRLELLNEGGDAIWQKDFSPRLVYRAALQRCIPPIQKYRSNLCAGHIANVFLSSITDMDRRTQPTLGSTEGDGRIIQIDESGDILTDMPLSTVIRAGDYGYISRGYIEGYQARDLDGDRAVEIVARVLHGRGMFPSALLFLTSGRLVQITSPGHIGHWDAVPEGDGRWCLCVSGRANRMGHLDFIARVHLDLSRDQAGVKIWLVPHLIESHATSAAMPQLLVYYPTGFGFAGGGRLPALGVIELENRSGSRLRIEADGRLRLSEGDEEVVFFDPPQRLRQVYAQIQKALMARDLHYRLEEAAECLERAADAGVENPWLKSVICLFRGDVAVRLGRYAEGRRFLERALDLNPGSNDAAHRLLETEFLQNGPHEALAQVMGKYRDRTYFWGLSAGRQFFQSLCLFQQGDFSAVELFSNRMEQDDPRNAELLRLLHGLLTGERIAARLPGENSEMSLLYTWEEYRLLEGRALLLAGEDPHRGEFCFRDVQTYSRFRRHLTAMSLAWYMLKNNRAGEAERQARDAFADLQKRVRGDLETRFWWFYDAWVYGCVMEELGDRSEARRGYAASIAANPHTALAALARKRLAD